MTQTTVEPRTCLQEVPQARPIPVTRLYAVTIFVSAFLLFQVQLLLGKYLLPWFGGTPAVWNTCLLFFQTLLLAGYMYAHFTSTRLRPKRQAQIHACLLLASVALMVIVGFVWNSPITPGNFWRPRPDSHPILLITCVLAISTGLPFFVLSTTGPLLQKWFSQISSASPYRLYALSNLGSFLGLLLYPFAFEPNMRLSANAWLWSGGYIIFVGFCILCARAFQRHAPTAHPEAINRSSHGPHADRMNYVLWLALPACASTLLLATTNRICSEIAVIPLLWVAPLAVYLLTFILCFEGNNCYRRGLFHPAFGIVCCFLVFWGGGSITIQIVTLLTALFIACMVCHGELARLKPATNLLTNYYTMIALGGALGGALVAVVAPQVFTGYWEFQLAWIACGMLLGIAVTRDRSSWLHEGPAWLGPAISLAFLLLLLSVNLLLHLGLGKGTVISASVLALSLVLVLYRIKTKRGSSQRVWSKSLRFVIVSIGALTACLFLLQMRAPNHSILQSRNFFGVLRILEQDSNTSNHSYMLVHGQTVHGFQYRAPERRRITTAYYGPRSGIALALTNHPRRMNGQTLRIGALGLGVGTITSYAGAGDYLRYYEIDPSVISFSQGSNPYFTFVKDSLAHTEIVTGDGRISMERELDQGNPQQFDILAVDAFSSDAIPVHLLTREAFNIYLRHLRNQDSVLAIHITNRLLDLEPPIRELAHALSLNAIQVLAPADETRETSYSNRWVLLSRSNEVLRTPGLAGASTVLDETKKCKLWTDDYSNLFRQLK